jgi:hypothetical protein
LGRQARDCGFDALSERIDVMERAREQYGVELFIEPFRPLCTAGIHPELPRDRDGIRIDIERHDIETLAHQPRCQFSGAGANLENAPAVGWQRSPDEPVSEVHLKCRVTHGGRG